MGPLDPARNARVRCSTASRSIPCPWRCSGAAIRGLSLCLRWVGIGPRGKRRGDRVLPVAPQLPAFKGIHRLSNDVFGRARSSQNTIVRQAVHFVNHREAWAAKVSMVRPGVKAPMSAARAAAVGMMPAIASQGAARPGIHRVDRRRAQERGAQALPALVALVAVCRASAGARVFRRKPDRPERGATDRQPCGIVACIDGRARNPSYHSASALRPWRQSRVPCRKSR